MPKSMADGMNHVRAMRLAEIVQEFRNLQHYLSQLRNSFGSGQRGEGFALLEQCYREGQALLNPPAAASGSGPNGDLEKEKAQLREVILDAAARRFQAQAIYLRATAAMRWVNSRNALGSSSNGKALQAVDEQLRRELNTITDQKIYDALRSNDQAQGKWIAEDPDIRAIRNRIGSRA